MGHAARKAVMTAEEFLAWEAEQEERHEFVDGVICAMAGAEDRHVTVTGNVYMALRQHLIGKPCRAFFVDMKVASANDSRFFYPDVVVTCSATDRQSRLIKREPRLIVEVLSPGTAAYDMGLKFAYYRRIPSLCEVVFIDVDVRMTSVFRKNGDGLWVLHPFDAGEDVVFASVDLTIPFAALFADVDDVVGSDEGVG